MNISEDNRSQAAHIFLDFILGSTLSYVGAGSSGLGLSSLNTTNDIYKILTTNNENVVCSNLFIKLVPIYTANNDPEKFDLYVPGTRVALIYPSAEKDFWKEVYLQNEIYKKTNENLEPICPPIVYSECLNNEASIDLLQVLFERLHTPDMHDKEDDALYVLKNMYSKFNTLKLGIIGMGFTTGYTSLFYIIRNKPPKLSHYINLAVYELVRLYKHGYMHGDFSSANIMINPTYNYTGANSGRAMLIDFGMSFKHHFPEQGVLQILRRMLNTPVETSRVIPINHPNYKWLKNYVELPSDHIAEAYDILHESISSHSTSMMNMIENTHPYLLAQIRTYNTTAENTNIFYGGKENAVLTHDVIPYNGSYTKSLLVDEKISPNVKSMSMIELNHIFNPNNLDISQLLDAYLRTLRLGEQTMIEYIKSNKGGKNKRKASRKRKYKTKQRMRTYKRRKSNHTKKRVAF